MFTLFSKYFIFSNLVISSVIPLFSSDLLMIWFFMEINNLLFIFTLNFSIKNKKMIFFYFFIQTIISFLIIYSLILNNLFMYSNVSNFFLTFALLMKLSIPPFHLWLPLLAKFMNWHSLLLLLTMMKIIPFYMISLIKLNLIIIYSIIFLCSILPPYLMLNLTNFKMLLSYSSINQSGWMMFLIYFKIFIWFKYFMFYTFISLSLFNLIYYSKMFFHNNFLPFNYHQTYLNFMPLIFMFNMAGLPPFSFFLMKWYSIFLFSYSSNQLIILIMLMLSSLIMLYIYTNMMISSVFFFQFKSKLHNFKFFINNTKSALIYSTLFISSILFL
uniref:NADH-ubiquinone oxidoreductase chain 2 n=1 Tax=Solenopsis geminata TaxID=121131 RepID=E3VRU4_SOLGE|nr:NADH dehydrogenase subunit 2 [Solenopsis geminata]ADP01783.1 NADH dehydrogenase subunit 2 [Solenopsis geminata]